MDAPFTWTAVAAVAALAAALLTGRALRSRAAGPEERLNRREATLDAMLADLREREARVQRREDDVEARLADAARLAQERMAALERLAGMSAETARRELYAAEEEEVRRRVHLHAADLEAEAREQAEHRARDIVCTAMQRLALSTVSPATTVMVTLPEGDMKARIIGREGRNIRSFEERTGVNLVMDEIPGALLLSSFDPRRREIARLAMEELIADGHIYPATIEAQVARAEQRVADEARRAATDAAAEARVGPLPPELVEMLGHLYLRTAFGQNVLQHSVEVAHLAGLMAQELGVDADLARRAGLLHDIGKVHDEREVGSHAAVGARAAARYGESPAVCHAVEAHHGEVEASSPEAVLVQTADAISLSRPGGRREPLEQYMTRMRHIEELCASFDGVERVHAMQSGRDIRVMVSPQRLTDEETRELARRIAARVESEAAFPGRVTVTVVRELRATEIVP